MSATPEAQDKDDTTDLDSSGWVKTADEIVFRTRSDSRSFSLCQQRLSRLRTKMTRLTWIHQADAGRCSHRTAYEYDDAF